MCHINNYHNQNNTGHQIYRCKIFITFIKIKIKICTIISLELWVYPIVFMHFKSFTTNHMIISYAICCMNICNNEYIKASIIFFTHDKILCRSNISDPSFWCSSLKPFGTNYWILLIGDIISISMHKDISEQLILKLLTY